ncbi:hypothetical protein CCUS01_11581 [Colletotrichum cuscutae]|uniref:Uncharacterized protein n=1 Tax=Colletotrichum cuscutae TaxID=1209917 RepID=A0AAI9XGC6_9PEZI|nr:hypothetical protein CCUS01_11581 [Colletotrichum cuscutae]
MYLHRRSKLTKLYLLVFCGLLVNQLTKKRLRLTAAFSFMLATRLPHTAHSHTRSHTISNYAPPTPVGKICKKAIIATSSNDKRFQCPEADSNRRQHGSLYRRTTTYHPNQLDDLGD